MRSLKRSHKPVRRYRSLLFPGISVLAVFAFYAAFVSPAPQKGETARFEQDGLCIEITGVHHIGGIMANFDLDRKLFEPYDTYYVYPGSVLSVLKASGEAARWELRREEGEALALADGMRPVKLTEDFDLAFVYDLDTGLKLLSFQVTGDDEEYWK